MNTHAYKKFTAAALLAVLLLGVQTCNLAQAQTRPTRPAEADKLHVILLVNGTDKSIGVTCLHDIQGMRSTLAAAFAKDTKRIVIHNLAGKNGRTGKLFSDQEVMAYIKNMKIGNNDNVLVYHSGHGGCSDPKNPEKSHGLAIDGGTVNRFDIETTLWNKKPRAVIVLTDCCSVFPAGSEGASATSGTGRPAPDKLNVQTVRNLLLKTTGLVSITAADNGKEASSGHVGPDPAKADGAFTVALLRLWYRQDVTYTSWRQFFPALRTETGKASGGKQFAHAFRLPK